MEQLRQAKLNDQQIMADGSKDLDNMDKSNDQNN